MLYAFSINLIEVTLLQNGGGVVKELVKHGVCEGTDWKLISEVCPLSFHLLSAIPFLHRVLHIPFPLKVIKKTWYQELLKDVSEKYIITKIC